MFDTKIISNYIYIFFTTLCLLLMAHIYVSKDGGSLLQGSCLLLCIYSTNINQVLSFSSKEKKKIIMLYLFYQHQYSSIIIIKKLNHHISNIYIFFLDRKVETFIEMKVYQINISKKKNRCKVGHPTLAKLENIKYPKLKKTTTRRILDSFTELNDNKWLHWVILDIFLWKMKSPNRLFPISITPKEKNKC